ncbi:hypothetical protein N9C33_04295 [Crocinitomicaceae bacterium]|nr:hypothetical protein [Crocinitomicaceae bacterium]
MKCSLFLFVAFFGLVTTAQVNEVDDQGRKQGKWEKLYEGTRVYMYRGQFTDDIPVGKFVYFYRSQKVKAVINHNVVETGRSVAFYYHEENGKTMSYGIYRNMKKDSVWTNFTPSGRLSSTETFKNGELDGIKSIYFIPDLRSDRSIVVSTTMNYSDGALNGAYQEFFLSKRLKLRGQFENNQRVGAWEAFHANGNRSSTVRYNDGVKHGYTIAYDTSGKRIGEQMYHFGKRIQGKRLENLLKQLEEKGINPYTMEAK